MKKSNLFIATAFVLAGLSFNANAQMKNKMDNKMNTVMVGGESML